MIDVSYAEAETLSLYNFTDDIALAEDGYRPSVPGPGDAWVTDAISLIVRGTSDDDLASNFLALDALLRKIEWADEGHERYRIWLKAKLTNETRSRYYMIRNYALSPIPVWQAESRKISGSYYYVAGYTLSIERSAMGEGYPSNYTAVNVSSVGGLAGISGSGSGVAPGRLASLAFRGRNGSGGPMYKFWLGLRGDRNGTPSNFEPNWHTKDGTLANSTSSTVDANAKSGTRTTCTFADPSLLPRVTIRADQASASNYNDQRGRFLVLLRAKVSDSGVICRVRLLDGLASSASFRTQDRIELSSTSYLYYELGTVQIPSPGREFSSWASSNSIAKYALRIEAERTATAGSGALHMDCLTLIPIDECFVYAEGGAVEYSGSDERPLVVGERPDGIKESAWFSSDIPQAWGVPKITGGMTRSVSGLYAVLAAQRSTVSTLSDAINIGIDVALRYPTLRGTDN